MTVTDPTQHPHHSSQSWRDRWVKYVSNRPRPNFPQEDPQSDARVRDSPGHDPSLGDHPPQSQAGPSNANATPARDPVSTAQKQATTQGRNKFTKEDDEILLRIIREKREAATAKGKRARLDGNKIFQDLEAKASLVPYTRHMCVCLYVYNVPLIRQSVSEPSPLEILA